MYPFFNFKVSLGIDIQANYVSLVQLQYWRSYHSVKKVAIMTLPPGTIVEGQIKDRSILTEILKKLTQSIGPTKNVSVALPSQNLITTRIQLSHLFKEQELATEIHTNLTRYFPGMSSELYCDFVIINSDPENYNILLIAARISIVRDYLQILEEVGLTVSQVTTPLLSVLRVPTILFNQNYFGMIEIGLSSAHLIILNQKKILLSQLLTYATFEELTLQLTQSLKKWQVTSAEPLQMVYWLGDEKYLIAIHPILETECKIDIRKVDLASWLSRDPSASTTLPHNHSSFTISYGLALQNKKIPNVNLLPLHKKQKDKQDRLLNVAIYLTLSMLCICLIMVHVYLQNAIKQKSRHITKMKVLLIQQNKQSIWLKDLQNKSKAFSLVHQKIAENLRQQNQLFKIFYHLMTEFPNEMSLNTFNRQEKQIDFSGTTQSSQVLNEWLQNFPNADIREMKHGADLNTFNFQVSLTL